MKVLLTGAFNYSDIQISMIRELGYDIVFEQNEFTVESDISDVDAIVCNNLFSSYDINQCKNLKFIQLTSSGIDRVPITKIKEKNIILCNAKDVYNIPIAEFIITKILNIYKNSRFFDLKQSQRIWEKNRNIIELNNKNIFILGTGSIGGTIAKYLNLFGCNITGFSRLGKNKENFNIIYKIGELKCRVSNCDILIITLPLTDETKYLVGKEILSQMKEDSVIVNVARGKIIDEEELLFYIKSGKFLGVALDVFDNEPLEIDNELWDFERVYISPHNSFISNNNNDRMFDIILNNLKIFADGDKHKMYNIVMY